MDKNLKKYIKENYIKPKKERKSCLRLLFPNKKSKVNGEMICGNIECCKFKAIAKEEINFVKSLQETFVQCLFRIIDEKGLKDSEVYKKANVDRKLFSKIRSNINYKPSKNTSLAFAIALELNLEETKVFLERAGYALSKSILTDVIVEYYIINKQYNLFKINETICDYKLQPLGSNV